LLPQDVLSAVTEEDLAAQICDPGATISGLLRIEIGWLLLDDGVEMTKPRELKPVIWSTVDSPS
jgi:hypothetical protein